GRFSTATYARSLLHRISDATAERGLRNKHGFGVKADGLDLYGDDLNSADSQAWSEGERRRGYPRFEECVGQHKNCANCPKAALLWYGKVLTRLTGARQRLYQPRLFDQSEEAAA
ncbi:DUF7221 family queuine tRNA-ribosyltransferase-like protein, partial [Nonomuraea insulae]